MRAAPNKGILNLRDNQKFSLNLDCQSAYKDNQTSDEVRSIMIRRIMDNEPNEFRNQLYLSMHNLIWRV